MSIYTRDIELKGGSHAVLLIHGLAGTPLEMRFLAKALNHAGFTVSVPYIAGYGLGTPCSSRSDWLAAVERRFVSLKEQYQSVSVGGLCIGATLALALARRQPEIRALSLLSTTLQYDGWTIPAYQFLLNLAYYTPLRRLYSFHEREPYGLKNVELRARVARTMASTTHSAIGAASISMEHIYHARKLGSEVRKSLPHIRNDALIIHAIDDDTASPKNADLVFGRIASPCKKKILLDDCYHIITMDNERELVARQTRLFFEEAIRRDGNTKSTPSTGPVNRALWRVLRQR